MKTESTLRWRMTLAMLAVVSVSSIIFALVIFLANHQLELALLDTRVKQEMEDLSLRLQNDEIMPLRHSADVRIYLHSRARITPIPDSFFAIEPGFYHDINLDGRW